MLRELAAAVPELIPPILPTLLDALWRPLTDSSPQTREAAYEALLPCLSLMEAIEDSDVCVPCADL
jgi:hypothetical protein